jgi:O-antigen/teichoic acid export membrane protein
VLRFADARPRHADDVDRFHAAALRIKLLAGLALIGAAVGWGHVLSPALLGSGASPSTLPAVMLVTVALQLVRSAAVRLQADGRFAAYAALDAVQGLTRIASVAGALWWGQRSAEALLSAYALGTVVSCVAGPWAVPFGVLRGPWPRWDDLVDAARHVALTAGIVACGTLTGRADIPLVAARSAEEAGTYAVAVQVSMLLTMLASYYSVVMQPRILRVAAEGQLPASLRWNAGWAGVVCLGTAVMAFWGLPALLPAFFGARYAPAVPIAQVLLVGTCLDLFCMPVVLVFVIQRYPTVSLIGEGALALGFLGVASAYASLSTLAVAWLVTGVRAAKLLFYLAVTLAYLRRRSRPSSTSLARLAGSSPRRRPSE